MGHATSKLQELELENLDGILTDWVDEPIGTASIGQVYKAVGACPGFKGVQVKLPLTSPDVVTQNSVSFFPRVIYSISLATSNLRPSHISYHPAESLRVATGTLHTISYLVGQKNQLQI